MDASLSVGLKHVVASKIPKAPLLNSKFITIVSSLSILANLVYKMN